MLDFIQGRRVEIYLIVLTIVFVRYATAFPEYEPAWALGAFVVLLLLDYWYIHLPLESHDQPTLKK